MLQWDISLGSQLCNKTDNRFILLLLMGPIGILEKKAGGKEQQKHVPMICSVPAHQFCCFQSDSHFKIQCFSYVSLDIYPFELPYKGSISRAEVLGGPTKFRAARILPLGSNCPLSCSCQSHGNHCETPEPWNTSARGNPSKKHGKGFEKKSKWIPGSSDHCGRSYDLRRKFLNPALAAVPEVTQIQFLLLSQEPLRAKTYSFSALCFLQRVIFLMTEGWFSLPHHLINDWNSWACKEGLGSHLTSTDSGEKSSEHNTQETRSWSSSLARSHGLEPGGCVSQMSCLWCTPAGLE